MKYNLGIAGGTFDHFHTGHETFLLFAFAHAKHVIIGITSDLYVKKNKGSDREPFETRKQHVTNFLKKNNLEKRAEIISIDDIYGNSTDIAISFDVLFATEDTKKGAIAINQKRKEKNLLLLPIEMIPMVKNTTKTIVSSTKIRSGAMDRKGNQWMNEQWTKETLVLPHDLRDQLQRPFGTLLQDFPDNLDCKKMITVGDETTKKANEKKSMQHLSIVDFVVERSRMYASLDQLGFEKTIPVQHVTNPASQITPMSWESITQALTRSERSVIQVHGEEDLLVLPCIILAPLSYQIFYGQPGEGIVQVIVSEETKNLALSFLSRFSRLH